MTHPAIQHAAKKIRLLLLDVDGVLTSGYIWISDTGHIYKPFFVQDGLGIQRLQNTGVTVGIISGGYSLSVSVRMEALGIQHIHQNCKNKLSVFNQLKETLGIDASQIAFVGDDLPDLPVIQAAGLGIAVANAVEAVREGADWITQHTGGKGAVREVCDLLINTQR